MNLCLWLKAVLKVISGDVVTDMCSDHGLIRRTHSSLPSLSSLMNKYLLL